MLFQAYLIFQISLAFLGFFGGVKAVYENNPFLQDGYMPPGLVQTLPTVPTPTIKAPVKQPPVTLPVGQSSTTTKEPLFIIEPFEILHGTNKYVHKKCLKPRGQFPSGSCNTYLNCWDDVAIEQRCLGTYLFNPVKLYCDFPENVDCQGKPITIKATSTPTALPNNEVVSITSPVLNPPQAVTPNSAAPGINFSLRKLCQRSTGLFPGSSCGKFVNCWADNAVEQDCPAGLFFSSEGYCDYPENVHCDGYNKDEEISTSTKSGVIAKDTDCLLEFGNFRNRSDCGQYYTCAFNKIAARYHCPDGFSFSDILGICDYSYRVDCSKEPQAFDVREGSKGQELLFNAFAHPDLFLPASKDTLCTVANGLVRDPKNCSAYYVCDSGKVAANYVCPSGFKFSNDLGICDYEQKVDCNNPGKAFEIGTSKMPVVLNLTQEVLSLVQKCVPGSVFRLNPQCTSACLCRDGIAEIIRCSAGLAYDSNTNKCIMAHLAKC